MHAHALGETLQALTVHQRFNKTPLSSNQNVGIHRSIPTSDHSTHPFIIQNPLALEAVRTGEHGQYSTLGLRAFKENVISIKGGSGTEFQITK